MANWNNKKKYRGSTEGRTRIAGFEVQNAIHYTIEPQHCFLPGSNRRPCACEAHVITATLRKLGWSKLAANSMKASTNLQPYGILVYTFKPLSIGRGNWRTLVIQLPGGQSWWKAWGLDTWWTEIHVDPASALRLASTWAPGRSPQCPGCLMKGESGQGPQPASKSPHVGQ